MNAERVRSFLLGLPHVVETEQWGGIVFWVGDKAIGGKMFVMLPLDGQGPVVSYPAGQDRYGQLVELENVVPAPYMARIWWVAAVRWEVFAERRWEGELRKAHELTLAKLAPKAKTILALPKAEQRRVVMERRKLLAEKARAKVRV